jgi:hypothetical protein
MLTTITEPPKTIVQSRARITSSAPVTSHAHTNANVAITKRADGDNLIHPPSCSRSPPHGSIWARRYGGLSITQDIVRTENLPAAGRQFRAPGKDCRFRPR